MPTKEKTTEEEKLAAVIGFTARAMATHDCPCDHALLAKKLGCSAEFLNEFLRIGVNFAKRYEARERRRLAAKERRAQRGAEAKRVAAR